MKDKDYLQIIELKNVGGGYVPSNEGAKELCESNRKGEIISFKHINTRDISMHRCYFALLNYIHGYLPKRFKESVPEKYFYKWLKHLKKEYKIVYSFIDIDKVEDIISDCIDEGLSAEQASRIAAKYGKTDFIEYNSISFGRMSQAKFKEYVKEQLPYIYENVIAKFYEGDIYNNVIENIEIGFKRFFAKL